MKVLHEHLDPSAYKLCYIGERVFDLIHGFIFVFRHGLAHARIRGPKSDRHRQARKGAIAIRKIN